MLSPLRRLCGRVRQELSQTFRSLRHRNFRLYNLGQLISLTGSWMESVALQWITYQMTHSAWLLGLVAVCTNGPVLFFSLWGGTVADRFDRRRTLIATQWIDLLLAAVLTVLVATNVITVWMILLLSVLTGITTAFEMPCRQAIVPDLIEKQDMVNAVGVNSIILNTTRMIGPAVGAFLLATVGDAVCFGLNTLSFVAAIVTLYLLRLPQREKVRDSQSVDERLSITAGLKESWRNKELRNLFVLMLFTSFFGFQFSALLPVFVSDVFHESAEWLGFFAGACAFGSLAASLFIAGRLKPEGLKSTIKAAAVGISVTLLGFALSRSMIGTVVVLVLIGIVYSLLFNCSNSLLQLSVSDSLRGRVMSVYTMILLGASPFGSLVIGRVADSVGAPWAMAVCAIACGFSALFYITRK